MKKTVGVVAVLLVLAATCGPVSATNNPPSGPFTVEPLPCSAAHPGQQGAPHLRLRHGTSNNWSGYAVETSLASPQTGAVTDVKGSWVVPTVAGPEAGYSSAWVGIDGYSDGTVEQIGTEQDWSRGRAGYYAWFEMYPNNAYQIRNFPVKPGDTITAEVKYTSSGFVLTINNLTETASFTTTQTIRSANRSSAEWIFEAPSSYSGVLPLPNFGTVNFSGCVATLNGQTASISSSSWQNDPLTMESLGGAVEAQPTALSADGTSFSMISNPMAVYGEGQEISSGDTAPSLYDGSNFGAVVLTGSLKQTFTIVNSGSDVLNLTGSTAAVTISGSNAADFKVLTQPSVTVAANGGSTTFTVQFAPSAAGLRQAEVSIPSSDPLANPYTFAIEGTGETNVPHRPSHYAWYHWHWGWGWGWQ